MNSIALGEALKKLDSLVEDPIPGFALFVRKGCITVRSLLSIKSRSAILAAKIGLQRLFKTATKNHRSPRVFFAPAIQVSIAVTLVQIRIWFCEVKKAEHLIA